MSALEELTQLASEGGRRIFVGQDPIDLPTKDGSNCVYVLELPTSRSGAAADMLEASEKERFRNSTASG